MGFQNQKLNCHTGAPHPHGLPCCQAAGPEPGLGGGRGAGGAPRLNKLPFTWGHHGQWTSPRGASQPPLPSGAGVRRPCRSGVGRAVWVSEQQGRRCKGRTPQDAWKAGREGGQQRVSTALPNPLQAAGACPETPFPALASPWAWGRGGGPPEPAPDQPVSLLSPQAHQPTPAERAAGDPLPKPFLPRAGHTQTLDTSLEGTQGPGGHGPGYVRELSRELRAVAAAPTCSLASLPRLQPLPHPCAAHLVPGCWWVVSTGSSVPAQINLPGTHQHPGLSKGPVCALRSSHHEPECCY